MEELLPTEKLDHILGGNSKLSLDDYILLFKVLKYLPLKQALPVMMAITFREVRCYYNDERLLSTSLTAIPHTCHHKPFQVVTLLTVGGPVKAIIIEKNAHSYDTVLLENICIKELTSCPDSCIPEFMYFEIKDSHIMHGIVPS